jgi:hypothetical protein
MHTKNETIMPADAKRILETKNNANRPISQRTVEKYAQEMKAGRWRLNGESIIYGISGNLMDGQHRLLACVKANVPFETTVTRAVPDEYFDTLDDGKTRNLSDVLAIRGETYGKEMASALTFIHRYASGNLTNSHSAKKRDTIPTKQVLERLLETQSGIRNSVQYYWKLRQRAGGLLLPPSLAVGLHYIFSLVDDEKASAFFDVFQSGLNIGEGNPVGLLRARLIAANTQASSRLTAEAQYFYTVTAWNSYATGKKLTRMAYKPGESLPEIEGVPRSLMKDLL